MGNMVKHVLSQLQNGEDPNANSKQKQASLKACHLKTKIQIPKAARVESEKAKAGGQKRNPQV